MYERPGYATLLGRVRENFRALVRKQLELPRQEIAEILAANVRAAKWLGIAAAAAALVLIAFVVLLVVGIAGLISLSGLSLRVSLFLGALAVFVLLLMVAIFTGLRGYRALELRGPTRSIESFKETVEWAKARLLGRSES